MDYDAVEALNIEEILELWDQVNDETLRTVYTRLAEGTTLSSCYFIVHGRGHEKYNCRTEGDCELIYQNGRNVTVGRLNGGYCHFSCGVFWEESRTRSHACTR